MRSDITSRTNNVCWILLFTAQLCPHKSATTREKLLLSLEEIHEHRERLRFLAELGDHGAGAAHDLGSLAFLVDLAEAAVLTELLARVNHEQVHAALFAQRLHQLGVFRVVAVRGQAAELSGLLVEGLGAPASRDSHTG